VPDSFYYGFYQSVIADDLVLLRTFTHFSVCKVQEGVPMIRALMDIFAYAGKVNALLSALCAMDFDNDALQSTGVLRTNSHLTNLVKVFVMKFGAAYFHNITEKLIEYVLQAGDVSLKAVEQCDKMRVQQMVVTALHTVLKSGPLVPRHMRHLAAVLKSTAAVRFNRKQAVYHTLSGFFFLRFFTGAIMDATLFEGYRPAPPNIQATVLIPFAQLLQIPLNLNVYSGRYEIFDGWNHHFIKHIFPQLLRFTNSLADMDEVPEYPAPDQVTVQRALGLLIDRMVKNQEPFEERYREVISSTKTTSPMNWNFAAFLMSFFKTQ
jgi:hypothetical protein